MPTLNVSTGIAQGSAKGSVESISLSYFRSRSWEGESISPRSTFFIIYNFRLSDPFYPLISWCSRDFGYLNTLFSKSLDIPFLNCPILPERSLHHGITSVLFSALFILLHSIVRQIFVWAVPSPTLFDSTISSPSILTLCSFASLISPLSPVHSYGGWGPPPIHSYRVTGNEWHNHQWLLLWSRYIAGGGS